MPAQESIGRVQTNESKTGRASFGSRGAAVEFWIGLFPDQHQRLMNCGRVAPPWARHGQRYWPLKASPVVAATKMGSAQPNVLLLPVTVTYQSGLVDMVQDGTLQCADADTWRLWG